MIQHILLTPPDRLNDAQRLGLTLAHMSGSLGADGHLHLAESTGSGGWLLVGYDQPMEAPVHPRETVREMVNACIRRQHQGIIFDLELPPTPLLAQIIQGLEESLARRNCGLFLPEAYGNYSSQAGLYLSSALSGGSLRQRLESSLNLYGTERLALSIHRSAEDFFLPSPSGSGRVLTHQELREMLKRQEPSTFFSPDLCARYFTYMSRSSGAHFVLYDDLASLRKKQELAQSLGMQRFFWLFPQVEDLLPHVLLSSSPDSP